ncbi:hypothetical protein ABID19_006633 [Mesorhizobium robiniae]|uniref:Uncharacterized protein n=1 Tax=Mesorhizobium robiniae TaxID=559315 RepID=A0ABV2GZ55_9HYPH
MEVAIPFATDQGLRQTSGMWIAPIADVMSDNMANGWSGRKADWQLAVAEKGERNSGFYEPSAHKKPIAFAPLLATSAQDRRFSNRLAGAFR